MVIELNEGRILIPILYEDRSVLALDKPAGWMLAPDSWDRTGRNLHLALQSSLQARDYWAHSRNLKFLRFVHRLDADTSGVILFAKSQGVLRAYSELFEEHKMDKRYLAVVRGIPRQPAWTCNFPIIPDPAMKARMKALRTGASQPRRSSAAGLAKDAETHFRVLETSGGLALVEARPITGRTHQIRVHLAAEGHPVAGDILYGSGDAREPLPSSGLALRAVQMSYRDPFQKRMVQISAPVEDFLRNWGFGKPPAPQKPEGT